MTLPFSDKPERSSIYQDVKTETLQELTPEQFDTFKARMFSEGVNGLEDEYRRLLLLGLASDKVSVSGPLEVKHVSVSVSGAEDDPVLLFQPDEGQIWLLNWGLWTGDGTSNNFYQGRDATTAPLAPQDQLFFSSASSGKMCTDSSSELAGAARVYITYDTPVYVQTYNDTNGSYWAIWVTRLR